MENFPEDYYVPLNFNGIITNYKINSFGEVKGILTDCLTSATDTKTGRKYINIYINKQKHKMSLARAILSSFVSPPNNDYNNYEADHIDGNRENDVLSNLQWLTGFENTYKGMYIENKLRRGEDVKNHKFMSDIIDQIKLDIQNGLNNTEIKNKYKNIVSINNSDISSIRYGIKWKNDDHTINYNMYNIRKYSKEDKETTKQIIRDLLSKNDILPPCQDIIRKLGYEYNDSVRHFISRMIKEVKRELDDPDNIKYLTKKVKLHINEKSDKRICKYAMIPATDDNISKVRNIRQEIMKKYNLNKNDYNIIID